MLYPIGIQNFGEVRCGGYVYVDKTKYIYELARTGKYYFLGRPRRFGKSLLISTMEAYFKGKKNLFKGLAIEKLEEKWEEHPVLHLDLNTADYECDESLKELLGDALTRWEADYGTLPTETSLTLRFKGIIQRACEKTGKKVVILIDEYDKPLIQTISNKDLQDKYRATMKALYSVLKTQDEYIRFAFLTGVTKFGKVSIFSDLNNLTDISTNKEYSAICGITEAEIHENFDGPLHELAQANGLTYEEACAQLKKMYDGYHFALNTPGVYNPFSLINALRFKEFGNYWFETGTPSFLVELLKASEYDLSKLEGDEVDSAVLGSVESYTDNPIPMIYQSGYLTIKSYDKRFDCYKLAFPNDEVKVSFIKYLVPTYVPKDRNGSRFTPKKFIKDVEAGDAESFMARLQSFFANTSYEIIGDMEKYFQNALFIVFTMLGFYSEVERRTSKGRIDIVLRTPHYIYLVECKLDKSAEEALNQIDSKGYALPYACEGRKLYKIGVNFSSETRGISDYKITEA